MWAYMQGDDGLCFVQNGYMQGNDGFCPVQYGVYLDWVMNCI